MKKKWQKKTVKLDVEIQGHWSFLRIFMDFLCPACTLHCLQQLPNEFKVIFSQSQSAQRRVLRGSCIPNLSIVSADLGKNRKHVHVREYISLPV